MTGLTLKPITLATHSPWPKRAGIALLSAVGLAGCVHPGYRPTQGYGEVSVQFCNNNPWHSLCIGGRQGSSGPIYNGRGYPQQPYGDDYYYGSPSYSPPPPPPPRYRYPRKQCGPTQYDSYGYPYRECWYNDAKDWLKKLNPLKSSPDLAKTPASDNPFKGMDQAVLSADLEKALTALDPSDAQKSQK